MIRLLGQVRLESGGSSRADVVPGGRRAILVLARLAVDAGVPVGARELAAVVWPDGRPAAWQASLRNVIGEVRSWFVQVGLPGAVRSSASGYLLDLPASARVDVTELVTSSEQAGDALAAGRDADVLALVDAALVDVRPGFLVGDDGSWVADTRQRLAAAVSTLIALGATAALRHDEPIRAEVLAARALEWDELRESSHRLLMRALRASGNRAAALEAYRRCRELLVERLGTEPDASTQALHRELLLEPDDPAGAAAATAPPLRLVRATSPLVGRGAQLRRIDALFEVARRRGPVTVRIEGEPGVGKTRLAAEVAARMAARGVPVLYGRADDHVDVSHRPLLEALDSHLATCGATRRRDLLGPHAAHLADGVPSVRDVVAPVPSTGLRELDQAHAAVAIAEVLGAVARPDGAVLVLDDLQWARRPTFDLLDRLRPMVPGAPLLVLVLLRSGDTTPVTADHTITLPGLDADEMAVLTAQMWPDPTPPGPATAREVWAQTGGNPLFATEILRAGAPAPEGDSRSDSVRSERLHELVRRRVAVLPRSVKSWLDVAVVSGLEFHPDVVAAASGLTVAAATAALLAAEDDGLVVAAANDATRRAFRHALVRQCLLDDLDDDDPAYVMTLHRQLGAVLEARRNASLPQLARHASAAAPLGDWRRAVRYGLAAARAAADALVHDDVVAVSSRTLALLADAGDPDPTARVQLSVLLGGALCGRRDPDGEQVLARAFADALELGDVVLAAHAALGFTPAGAAGDELAADTRQLALYEQALAALGDGSGALRAQLLGRLSTAYGWLRDGEAGRRCAQEALDLARAVGDVAVVSTVLVSTRRGLSGTGRPREERAIEDELLELADVLDDPGLATGAWLWRFESAVELGRGAESEESLERAAGAAEPSHRYTAAYSEAARLLLRGDLDAADVAVEAAHRLGGELGLDPMVVDGIRMIQLMGVRHEQGRLAELRDELAVHFAGSGVPEWEGTVAFADAELGRLDTIEACLVRVFEGYAAGGVRTGAGIGFAAHMAGPVARIGDRERAQMLYDLLLPHRGVGSYISYFAGPVDHALGLLARTLGRADDARDHAADAVAFCAALGAPRWAARCRAAALV